MVQFTTGDVPVGGDGFDLAATIENIARYRVCFTPRPMLYTAQMQGPSEIDKFISEWAITGGSELANTQSFVNGLCALLVVDTPNGSQTDDANNDYVFERRVFQDNGDGTKSIGRLDVYKRGCFVLEAKQGSDADREAAKMG
jgi:hypothetical protein